MQSRRETVNHGHFDDAWVPDLCPLPTCLSSSKAAATAAALLCRALICSVTHSWGKRTFGKYRSFGIRASVAWGWVSCPGRCWPFGDGEFFVVVDRWL